MMVMFDLVNNSMVFDVHMRKNPGLDVIQRRAVKNELLGLDDGISVVVGESPMGARVTLCGPEIEGTYRAIPLGVKLDKRRRKALTLRHIDVYVEMFNQDAAPSLRSRYSGKDLMDLVVALCV